MSSRSGRELKSAARRLKYGLISSAEDLKKSLPTLAQQDPRGIESIHRAAAHNLQANIMVRARRHDEPIKADEQSKAQTLFEHYRMGRSLQSIDRVVAEGDAYETTRTSDNARPDAWRFVTSRLRSKHARLTRRSDLSPEALTAAMNLQMYDEAWTRLRTEYIEVSARACDGHQSAVRC